MDAYEQVVRARIKAAVTLFSLSVLMALGIWLLNRTLLGNIDRYLAAREWYRQTLSMQGKMRAYEGQGENLFQALALAAIILRNSQLSGMSWNLRSVHEPVYGNIVDWDGGDSTTQAAAAQLQQAARTFGRNASRIIARTRDLDQRERLLDSALARSFGPESAQTIAYSLPSVLADVHGSVARPVIATWIAFGEWPRNVERLNLGVEYTPGVIEPVGYSERLKPRARLFDERHYIKYSLYQRHSTVEARRFIDSVSQTAYVELKQSSAPAPLITIGGTGLSPTVEDLLTFAVPVVVFLYALFLVFWQRETSGAVGIPPTGVAFGFPTFSCPADPLRAPCPRGISEFAQRSIWLLFLLLPTLLFDVGATLRYDLVAPAGVLSEWTLFEYLEKLRTHDRLSVFLDFVNLVALALSLMILAKITGVQRAATRSRHWWQRWILMGVKGLPALVLALAWYWALRRSEVEVSLDVVVFFTLYGGVWMWAYFYALKRRARLVITLALLVMMSHMADLIYFTLRAARPA